MAGSAGSGRLLVSGDEFHASLALVRALAAAGYSPVLVASHPRTYAQHSRAVVALERVPSAESEPADFVAAVAALAGRHSVRAILPGTEASLVALSARRGLLPARLGAPLPPVVDLATDKTRVLALAAQHGLTSPPSLAGPPDELRVRASSLTFPAILKPKRTRLRLSDGRLAYFQAQRVGSSRELVDALENAPDVGWVVQPYLTGDLCAVAGLAWGGEVLATVHQVARRVWPRDVGYSSYAETVAADPELDGAVRGLLAEIGWSGIFQLQMLCPPDGERLLIDFNPRAYGSLALAVRAGANLPAAWAALVLGERPPLLRPRVGVRYRLEHNEVRAILAMLRERRPGAALSALRPRRDTAHAVFSLRDPGPLIVTVQKFLGRGDG